MTGMPDNPAQKSGGFLGSLRDALAAAGKEEHVMTASDISRTVLKAEPAAKPSGPPPLPAPMTTDQKAPDAAKAAPPPPPPSAAEAARAARAPQPRPERHVEADTPPTTRVVRGAGIRPGGADDGRTQVLRGKQQVRRDAFHQDPVVGWLVIVGGPGLGSYRPIFEGNNTIGRAGSQRIALDFGDDSISSEEQAYIRYDSVDRAFLFVPNLAKTNVVQINDKKPTAAVSLTAMDVITMGRTQLVFVPFCGQDFDWSELAEAKT